MAASAMNTLHAIVSSAASLKLAPRKTKSEMVPVCMAYAAKAQPNAKSDTTALIGLASVSAIKSETIMAASAAAMASAGCVATKSAGEAAPRGDTLKREANTPRSATRIITTASNTVRRTLDSAAGAASCGAGDCVASAACCIDDSMKDASCSQMVVAARWLCGAYFTAQLEFDLHALVLAGPCIVPVSRHDLFRSRLTWVCCFTQIQRAPCARSNSWQCQNLKKCTLKK